MTTIKTTVMDAGIGSGLHAVVLKRAALGEVFLTASGADGSNLETQMDRIVHAVRAQDARMVSQQVFHAGADRARVVRRMQEQVGDINWPITWVENGKTSRHLTGIFVHAVCGAAPETILVGGRVVGTVYEDTWARHVNLGGLYDHDVDHSAPHQARQVFCDMREGLAQADVRFSDVLRTWFYNRDILSWYGDFNRERTALFQEHGVFDGLVPASTGIGARNPFGAALTAALIAVKPKGCEAKAFAVPSPLQGPALRYGSSFSRAVELRLPDHRRLYVSGTASIDADGQTVHRGDSRAQVAETMRIVQALLESRAMAWSEVVRAVAYFRNAEDAPLFRHYCQETGLPPLPVIVTHNVICRDDLLFEIELDAVAVQ